MYLSAYAVKLKVKVNQHLKELLTEKLTGFVTI